MEFIKSVRTFMEAAGHLDGQAFNQKQVALQTGFQCEELAEKFSAVGLETYATILHNIGMELKEGRHTEKFLSANRAELLDADLDIAYVTIGSALSQGADVEGAAGEVARANLSKLVMCPACKGEGGHVEEQPDGSHLPEACQTCNGLGLVAIKDVNQKVMKPEGWTPPNIEPFVRKDGQA